jgi:hypothetical protein
MLVHTASCRRFFPLQAACTPVAIGLFFSQLLSGKPLLELFTIQLGLLKAHFLYLQALLKVEVAGVFCNEPQATRRGWLRPPTATKWTPFSTIPSSHSDGATEPACL